jgi:hypothetical protein
MPARDCSLRGTIRTIAGVVVVAASALSSVGIAQAAGAAVDRQASCAEAWSLIAQESGGLESGDPAAWSRVSDGFISMSDASFDGPLSNALGYVSTAAGDYATALQPDGEGDPSRAAFNASLAGLGGVCAKLSVTPHKVSTVPRFVKFRYQTGVLTGLSPSASELANTQISRMVQKAVTAARRPNHSPCLAGARKCGYFVVWLNQPSCMTGLVCISQRGGLLPVGANDGREGVTTLALDGRTGRAVPITRVVPAEATATFVANLNAAVREKLALGGLANEPYWQRVLTLGDVHAWPPEADGVHVWFDKYAVAPGSFDIVDVVIPWASVTPNA